MRLWILSGLLGWAFLMSATADPGLHDKIVACYWGAWSIYRVGDGSFDVDDIDPTLCTHGFYGFAELDNTTWQITPVDPWYDQSPDDPDCDEAHCNFDSYRRFVALKSKNPDFIPMISIGGWNSGSGRFSAMAKDPAKKQLFLDSLIPFLERYGFEGVDFDWEYPSSRPGSDPDNDKENFSNLIEEMSTLLKASNKLLTAAVTPNWRTVQSGYDVPRISQYFDFINVMTYDYHGWWPQVFTGHNSPLYPRPEDNVDDSHPGYFFNVFDSVNFWISQGAPKEKIVMGMPLYGRGFQLNNTEENGIYCPAKAGIPPGPYTLQEGIWGFQEILQAFNNATLPTLPGATPQNWSIIKDDCYHAPYAVNGPYWVGYDDVESFSLKAKYANFLGIGGGMVWSIDTDDFRGTYHDQTFPLLRAIHDIFASAETFDPENPKCVGTASMCSMFDPPTTTAAPTTTTAQGFPCTEHNELLAYPGDCHKYYMCIEVSPGQFKVNEYTCGEWVFDPNVNSCVNPSLPGFENLC